MLRSVSVRFLLSCSSVRMRCFIRCRIWFIIIVCRIVIRRSVSFVFICSVILILVMIVRMSIVVVISFVVVLFVVLFIRIEV